MLFYCLLYLCLCHSQLVKDCRQIIEETIQERTAYRGAAMLVTGSDQMKQEQVTVEMEHDLHRLLEVMF